MSLILGDGGLEAVLLANRSALLRFLRARGAADADELFQELWLRLQNAAPTGPVAEPLAYLYRMADNLMHDRRRSARRRERRETDWADIAGGSIGETSESPSAERILVARDELARMEAALVALGDRTAAILRRFRLEGQPQKAIAADLGISLSAVEKHLQRAYNGLAAARAGYDDADRASPRRHLPDTKSDAGR